ncbi:TPX2 and/or Mitofilin domain containing protein [Asbolus verrucosus]|uniref:TPX2 and/or Mitofilin domain containing protein n=1 Tax=Asbolus verrucosus TaxID=1661398 RepID=A0A482W845_ASBVE|nr:TPX2 and/or Mitofilin domain containing protein [Asbolus verrucosus]
MRIHRNLVIALWVILHISWTTGKAVAPVKQPIDQEAVESQQAQKRVGYDYGSAHDTEEHIYHDDSSYGGHEEHHEEHHDEHHEVHHDDHHDPGYWKKKVIWKKGWKKIWKPDKKQIWKPSWKKIWKPIWVPTKKPAWKEIQVPDWKKIWKPVWKEIKVPAWKEIQVPDWKKIWKPVWKPIKVPAWKEIQVPDWKKIWKPVWKEIQVPAWKEIQVPAWKKLWQPVWVKEGIHGEHYLGKDHHGNEYTAHDIWKKKLIWKPIWKKYWKPAKKQIWVTDKKLEWKEAWKQIWRTEKKQIWVEDKKLVWKEAWKQIWRTEKKQIWVADKKLEWKEAWKQIWRTEKKQIWVADKKLEWKEAWKQIWVPAWKEIWVPGWKMIWKPVIIQEWFPSPDHHDHHKHHGWDRKDAKSSESNVAPFVTAPTNQKLWPVVLYNKLKYNSEGAMSEEFAFNARQYFDFSKDHEDFNEDSFFAIDQEDNTVHLNHSRKSTNDGINEFDDGDDIFFSPEGATGISSSTIYLKCKMRKSLSLNNLPTDPKLEEVELEHVMDELNLNNNEPNGRPGSSCSLNNKIRCASKQHINRLAQPKRFGSSDNVNKGQFMSLAEAVNKFQAGTPKRFRSRPSPKINKIVPVPWGGTKAHSPKLMTTKRTRPVPAYVISKEEQERLELEEAKKFKIRANPVNKRILKGPLKPQMDKKPPTTIEPFNLTEVKKRDHLEETKVPVFKAQPLPKSLYNPFKIQETTQQTTKTHTPKFLKRVSKSLSKNELEKNGKTEETSKSFKPTKTQPIPFSFEKRDQELQRKKEEFINKVLEEEKKAREFHAKPPPKSILRARNRSLDQISEASSSKNFKRSIEELETTTFKAKPATVLSMKPFEPKKDENHVLKIEAFQFTTDQRVEARHKFEQQLKEKEAMIAALANQKLELLRMKEEEEIAKLRKEAEHKAQPIKKYKEIKIKPANKVTQPVSPIFHTDRLKNKENVPN